MMLSCNSSNHSPLLSLFLGLVLFTGPSLRSVEASKFWGAAPSSTNKRSTSSTGHDSFLSSTDAVLLSWRGGASRRKRQSSSSSNDPFVAVARAIQDRLGTVLEEPVPPEIGDIVDAFGVLSSSQQTFKGLDGAAHEAYQRTHDDASSSSSSSGDAADDLLKVRGRARRSAARAAATADGLGACEFCELLEMDPEDQAVDVGEENVTDTLTGREILLNVTIEGSKSKVGSPIPLTVVVLYEPNYTGGAGMLHGGIDDEDTTSRRRPNAPLKGRLVVIVGDSLRQDLTSSLEILDQIPKQVRLTAGLSSEVASVQPSLYKAAGALLHTIEPTLREYDNQTSAIHFVGRSLAGGVTNLAAMMLDGDLPLPKIGSGRKKHRSSTRHKKPVQEDTDAALNNPKGDENSEEAFENTNNANNSTATTILAPLEGLGKDRTSAVSIGAPPCVSANVQADFCIAIMYGDDVVCRATRASIDRLLKRSKKALNSKGWLGGKQLNFMTDALSLTVSSLKTHAHGSEGEELRLSVPGRAYLLRPRRLGGMCSIHEVGNRLKGGREALRAQVLWQLDDILLSKSLWKHHQLNSYIHGLDRAHLRGFSDEEGGRRD